MVIVRALGIVTLVLLTIVLPGLKAIFVSLAYRIVTITKNVLTIHAAIR